MIKVIIFLYPCMVHASTDYLFDVFDFGLSDLSFINSLQTKLLPWRRE